MKKLASFKALNGESVSLLRELSTGKTCLATRSARHFMELKACWQFFKELRNWGVKQEVSPTSPNWENSEIAFLCR